MHLAKEEVDHLQEIACPNVFGVIVEKNRPGLTRYSRRTRQPDVFLNRCGGDLDVSFEKFATNSFSPPKQLFLGHLQDQVNRFDG